jgi:hypothetical protein
MVVHTCNPTYSSSRDKRIVVQGQPRQKHKTLYENQTKTKKDWECGSSGRVLA